MMLLLVLSPFLLAATPAVQERDTTLEQFLATRKERLLKADTNGDGRLSPAEWKQARSGAGGDSDRLFALVDTDKDGALGTAEIEAFITARFTRLDANGDKVVTRAEAAGAKQASAAD